MENVRIIDLKVDNIVQFKHHLKVTAANGHSQSYAKEILLKQFGMQR